MCNTKQVQMRVVGECECSKKRTHKMAITRQKQLHTLTTTKEHNKKRKTEKSSSMEEQSLNLTYINGRQMCETTTFECSSRIFKPSNELQIDDNVFRTPIAGGCSLRVVCRIVIGQWSSCSEWNGCCWN